MPHVICEPCVGCKDSSCWQVCPVDVIHPTPDEPDFATTEQLYIDPVGCVDCGACAPACPVEAIWRDDELPDTLTIYVEKNATFYDAHPADAG
jgi:NAD-dependent dihydropyrimidine dehydrogenase PreA subunit